MARAPKKELDRLHGELAKQLKAGITNGEVNASLLNVARQFLKDNNINLQSGAPAAPVTDLMDNMPFSQTDTDEDDPKNGFPRH